MQALKLDKKWTLFLDRDGVINKKLPNDYVKRIEEFVFIKGSVEAVTGLNRYFERTVVVTNQQGIGKGIMTKDDLKEVHAYMNNKIGEAGGKIDKVYFSPELASSNSIYRKPNTGMAEEARKDYAEIDFKKSVMVGDSLSDMQMGKRVGMITVHISKDENQLKEADYQFESLYAFYEFVVKCNPQF